MRVHLHVLLFLILLARAYTQTGNGVTTSCTQTALCPVGCYGTGNGICYRCGNYFYKPTVGTALCTACPASSGYSCLICSAVTGCRCNPGTIGPDGGPCPQCAAGTYKTASGSSPCVLCASGKYSTNVAASVATTCLACPISSGMSCLPCVTLTSCVWNAGYYGPTGGVASACPANSGASCVGCATLSQCTCNIGYAGPNGGPCTACTTATYKNSTGAATCNTCAANSGSTCSACYTSSCPCNAGYVGGHFLSPYSITACSRFNALILSNPKFKSVSTRYDVAVGSVSLPTYNALGGPNGVGHVTFDRTLLQYLDAGPRAFNLKTNGGFTIVIIFRFTGTVLNNENILQSWGSESTEFIVHRYGTTGQITFIICNNGETCWNTQISTVLAQNQWATVKITYSSSTFLFDMTLNGVGVLYDITGNWYDKTMLGIMIGKQNTVTTRNLNGDVAGVFVVDEWLSTAATTEIANMMSWNNDLTNIVCPTGTACTACTAGQYKSASGTSACMTCPSNSGSSCPLCTILTDCKCNAGFYGPSGGTCTACPANSGASCNGCAVLGSCSCNPGFYGTSGGTCTTCPANSGNAGTTLASCTCNLGYTGPSGGTCTACSAGTYKIVLGTTLCQACPTNSNSPVASTALAACTCNLGYTGPSGGACLACATGKYKDTTGSVECTNCAAGKYSAETGLTVACLSSCPSNSGASCSGCTALASCTCNLGYTGPNGGTCAPCAAGSYKSATGSAACTSCGAGTYSTSVAATTAAACLACPANSNSPAGSTAAASCTCNVGFALSNSVCVCDLGYEPGA